MSKLDPAQVVALQTALKGIAKGTFHGDPLPGVAAQRLARAALTEATEAATKYQKMPDYIDLPLLALPPCLLQVVKAYFTLHQEIRDIELTVALLTAECDEGIPKKMKRKK